jgi:hypothetical protein
MDVTVCDGIPSRLRTSLVQQEQGAGEQHRVDLGGRGRGGAPTNWLNTTDLAAGGMGWPAATAAAICSANSKRTAHGSIGG